MKTRVDLRTSLAAKCTAVFLLVLLCAGAALGTFAVAMLSCGYGASDTFGEDLLCREPMEDLAYDALFAVLDSSDSYHPPYYYHAQLERAGGIYAQVYDGDPASGALVGVWSEPPKEDTLCQLVKQFPKEGDGYYTVALSLSSRLPAGSNFAVRFSLYNSLHALPFGVTVLLTILLYAGVLALLVFLLCAAGHTAGREGISLNWQDRIPLDLYLLCVAGLFAMALELGFVAHPGMPMALEAATGCVGVLAAVAVALATLLTLATRLKKGKWWRNTVCWRTVRWCRRLWRSMWMGMLAMVQALPLTWRTVLGVGCVLAVQSILTLITCFSEAAFFFLLVTAAMDLTLVAAAALLSLQLQRIRDMGSALAAGDLEAQLDTEKMFADVKRHAEDLNAIGIGMNKAVEQRMKSERLKTELITNVSHDIKTPLTSIVNYVDLLKKEDLPPAASEYLSVLDRQSHRLKKLTEDLVEASKASTGNMTVTLEPIVVNEIIHQAVGDYDEKLAAGRLEVILNTYEGNLMALADGRLLWRVLDNLLSNVCKYALAGTRVYIDLSGRDGRVYLSIKNISRDPLNISADELMERFVRGDTSRHTEGSGLGLNIARSLMDLMGGAFSLSVDGDLFKAELSLKA